MGRLSWTLNIQRLSWILIGCIGTVSSHKIEYHMIEYHMIEYHMIWNYREPNDIQNTRLRIILKEVTIAFRHFYSGNREMDFISTENKTQIAVINILNLRILITWRFVC